MKYFKNFSKELFINSWDSTSYSFKPEQGMYLEDYLAEHHAKHLVDREIQRDGMMVDDPRRSEYLAKALMNAEVKEELKGLPEEVQIINMNVDGKEEVKSIKIDSTSKRGRPKKEIKKEEIKEEEFEELNN